MDVIYNPTMNTQQDHLQNHLQSLKKYKKYTLSKRDAKNKLTQW